MFDKTYEERLQAWSDFRSTLGTSEDPIQTAIDQYDIAPEVSIQTDPWNQDIWPSAWQLILENQYCEFCKLLGICYSLQLTDNFSASTFEIHIAVDRQEEKRYYLLLVDDCVIGLCPGSYINKSELPVTIKSQTVYSMKLLN